MAIGKEGSSPPVSPAQLLSWVSHLEGQSSLAPQALQTPGWSQTDLLILLLTPQICLSSWVASPASQNHR